MTGGRVSRLTDIRGRSHPSPVASSAAAQARRRMKKCPKLENGHPVVSPVPYRRRRGRSRCTQDLGSSRFWGVVGHPLYRATPRLRCRLDRYREISRLRQHPCCPPVCIRSFALSELAREPDGSRVLRPRGATTKALIAYRSGNETAGTAPL
jgi:hypothetical protein